MILGYNNLYIFWGAAQIIFVSITLFGIILGVTTVFSYSKEDRNFYYPTWKPAVGFYIVHSFEIIYVLCYLSIPSMQFVSAMGMLLPISLAFLCWPRYFFFKKTPRSIILLALLPFLVLIPMFINLIWPDLLPSFIVSNIPYLLCLLFLISSIAFIIYQYDCHKKQIKEYEMEYSSLSDFPKNFEIGRAHV